LRIILPIKSELRRTAGPAGGKLEALLRHCGELGSPVLS